MLCTTPTVLLGCLVRKGKDSEEGARDIGETCPVNTWSFVMTRLPGIKPSVRTDRAYAETSIIIIIIIVIIFLNPPFISYQIDNTIVHLTNRRQLFNTRLSYGQ